MSKLVALLTGGWSAEREVSLEKSKAVEAALKEAGYRVRVIDVTLDLTQLIADLTPRPDVVFNNLYGRGGEDGTIQGLLEIMEIPYTHSGVTASAIGMNKPLTKTIAAKHGVKTPKGIITQALEEGLMPRPFVTKPVNEGSSVGVHITLDNDPLPVLEEGEYLVEEYIPGREIHVTVLDGVAQGVSEIIVPGRFFDYEAKYKSDQTQLITPAKIPENIAKNIMRNAELTFNALGCWGLARCDFRYDPSKADLDGIYLLEINTLPGLAPGSIALIQPEMNGLTFPALCAHLVENAKLHNQTCQNKNENQPSSNDAIKKVSG